MVLPKYLTTVTPLSKTLALVIFTIFPIAGFFLGINYQSLQPPKIQYITDTKIVKVYPTESPKDLNSRCGQLPDKSLLGINSDRFTMVEGPIWSPDCRHLSWSSWQSGAMGVVYTGPYKHEGLFVYSDSKKNIDRGYISKEGESVEIKHWIDSDNIVFTINAEDSYIYNLSSKKTTLQAKKLTP